ncbi:MAG: glycosyltransferase family 2 protein [Candidatus Pacebacteria bacterium]|nr:glycosyltransferase family 2 protein [Candidatus Paceibacterota bacterium]
MKVSIITPAYNCAAFLEKCILSVKDQRCPDIEHIIVNDGSTDGTEEIIQRYEGSYGMKHFFQKNQGIACAMNKGFEAATGDVFAWLDADNFYRAGIVDEAVKALEENPDIDIVYGNIDFVDTSGKKTGAHKPPSDISFKKALVRTTGAIPLQPAVFFKRGVYRKTAGFDTRYRVAGDYDFWLQALKTGPKLLYLDTTFGSYTLVESGASQSWKGVMNGFREVYTVAERYHQPLYGKMMLTAKYAKGFLGKFVK